MKRKIIFFFIIFSFLSSICFATRWYFWRYRTHPTDCTSLTDGKLRDLCFEEDDQTLYKCDTQDGTCDTPSEWKSVSGGVSDFLSLTDTPSSYIGNAGKYLKVNSSEEGLDFDTPTGAGDITAIGDVTDGDAFTGSAGNILYFEGTTIDDYETILEGQDVNSDIHVKLPTSSGTLLNKEQIDTEAEFEAELFEVFTPSDGALADDDLSDNSINDLSDVDTTGWATNKVLKFDASGNLIVGDDNDTTYTADGEGIELSGTQFSLELDGTTLTKSASGLKVNLITSSEIIDGTIQNADIADNTIAESKLDIYNSPSDGYYLKYTSANGMEWAAGGGGASQLSDLSDVGTVSYTAGQYLRADGTDYDSSSIQDGDLPSSITRDSEWDTIGKIETAIGENIIISTEIDTEAELEGLLGDVTNVYTNNDGSLTDDDLSDNSINDLSDVDTTGVANGKVLKYNSTLSKWEVGDDNVTSPAGLDGQLQYNDGGSFGGTSGLTWDDANNELTVPKGYLTTTPTGSVDIKSLVNKEYVDLAVTSLGATYYMYDEDDATGYKTCYLDPSSDAETYIEKSGLADDDYIGGWISAVGEAPSKLLKGVYDWYLTLEKTGTKTLRVYWKLVERKSNGDEVVIATSSNSNEIDTKANYLVPLQLDDDYIPDSGSRIVGKLYADVSGGGSAPTIRVYYQGNTSSRWEIPANSEIFKTIFIPYDGAVKDVNLGSYDLTTTGTIDGGAVKVNGTDVLTSESDPDFAAMDTEAELESHLTDVTDVYTNNDGSLDEDDLSDNNISDLSNVVITSPSSGQVLKYNGSNWVNDTDNDTTYSAGTGLDLTGTTFSLSHLGLENLTDPNANRLYYWNDTNNTTGWLDYSSWDTDASDDFSGSWNDLADIPAGFADNTDDVDDADADPTNELQNIFQTITDGTNTATADTTTDTLHFRSADSLLTITVTNDDATYGDNVLFDINNNLSAYNNDVGFLTAESDPNFTAMDTEAELEAHLTDVSDVFTNNDGSLDDDDLSDNSINDLSDVNTTGWATGKVLKFDASGNLVVGDDEGSSYTAGIGIDITGNTISLSHLGLESLSDPNANRLYYWNDSTNTTEWLDYSGWDTNASDDFSGSWNDLTDIPAGFADNTDDVNDADSDSTNELQNIFQKISDGVNTAIADTTTDTFTFEAGSGINITINESNDKVTITNTGDTNASDDLTASTTFSGDISGSYNSISVNKIKGKEVDDSGIGDGKVLKYNATSGKIEYATDEGGTGSTTFVGLTDTPSSYSGQSGKVVKVNRSEDALEFAADDDVPDSGDLGIIDTEAKFEAELFAIFTPNDGSLDDDDVTLTDVQNACSNDFHNIGGADDDQPDDDSEVPDILSLTKIPNLTTNGFIKTSNSDGTLTIDTNTYLTSESDPIFSDMDTEAELESQLTDVTNIYTNNDGSLDDDDVTDDNVESMTTAGGAGTAPISDGAGNLTMTDVLTEIELDTEAELEDQLSDVTNVFTNNDGSLSDDDLSDNNLTDLSDVTITSPSNSQVLKYNSTSGKWENATDDTGTDSADDLSDNSINDLSDVDTTGWATNKLLKFDASGNLVVGDDNNTTYSAGTGLDLIGTTFSLSHLGLENLTAPNANRLLYWNDTTNATAWLDYSDWDIDSSDDLTTSTSFGGDVSGTYNNLQLGSGVIGSVEIADGSIGEADLNIDNSPTDEYVLTYEASTGNFEWQAQSGGGDMYKATYDTDDDGTVDEAEGVTDNSIVDDDVSDSADIKISAIEIIIDGGGQAISTGVAGDIEVPFNCTILQATALADQTGSIQVDIWKDTYANFPPTDADSITASAPVSISSSNKSQDSTLSGWTTTINAGDILRFNVDSASIIQRCTISLKVRKE